MWGALCGRCVVERDSFRGEGGSGMVWGNISHGVKSQLLVIAGKLPAGQRWSPPPLHSPSCAATSIDFAAWNFRPNVTRLCRSVLSSHNIIPLDWPQKSWFVPDWAAMWCTGLKGMETPEYPHHSHPVDKCIVKRMKQHSNYYPGLIILDNNWNVVSFF